MAQKSFRCRLVTPTASLVDDKVTYASIPAYDGLMGFLPGRAPILTRLGAGELRLDFADSDKGEGGTRSYFVDGGFVRMSEDRLTILAERAIPREQLTATDAEAELKSAKTPQAQAAARAKLSMSRKQGGI